MAGCLGAGELARRSGHYPTQSAAFVVIMGYGYSMIGHGYGFSEAVWLLIMDSIAAWALLTFGGNHWVPRFVAAVLAMQICLHLWQILIPKDTAIYRDFVGGTYLLQWSVIGYHAQKLVRAKPLEEKTPKEGPYSRWMLSKK